MNAPLEPHSSSSSSSPHLSDGLSHEQIRGYITRRESDMNSIRSAIERKDSKTIREITHKLKGNAALYGLSDFGIAAGRALNAADSADWESVRKSFGEMEEILRRQREKFALH